MRLPPTGREVNMTGLALFRLAGGKIVEAIVEENIYGMMQQLGDDPELLHHAVDVLFDDGFDDLATRQPKQGKAGHVHLPPCWREAHQFGTLSAPASDSDRDTFRLG